MKTDQPRTIALTGASSGIGASAARALVADGHRVVVIGRDRARTNAVADALDMPRYVADLDSLDAVRALADELRHDEPGLDTLANNAGGLVSARSRTADGLETTLQRNVVAPFVLANALADVLAANHGRMVLTSSIAHRFGHLVLDDLDLAHRPWFGGWRAYSTAKLAAVLLTRKWTARTGVDAFSFHPGFVVTGFGADSPSMKVLSAVTGGNYGISAQAGAVGLVRLAGDDDVDARTGTYFDGLNPGVLGREARDDALGAALWDRLAQRVDGWEGRVA
ncbi:SDR family NAD(P)-dependent oxidoreductase [Curtobacterium sp. RRHDQ10]|uniref:SDR family NAD(P)-dependent oxidoreductase n=1 Tax=Curtobacterium phyllosphaerae TaxID=3413379 RepID=UPI003BF1AA58